MSSVHEEAQKLVDQLVRNPEEFSDRGRTYHLLKRFFRGFPVEKLRPLLKHDKKLVRREAVWIASELGDQACDLLPDVVPLLESDDRFLKYRALHVVTVCWREHPDELVKLLRALESSDVVIRGEALFLTSNLFRISDTDADKLKPVLETFQAEGEQAHARGLELVIEADELTNDEIRSALRDDEGLVRRYAAVAAVRKFEESPELYAELKGSEDPDLVDFAERIEGLRGVPSDGVDD